MKLLPYGEIAEKYIKQLNKFYENISVEKYVIMPDHIHILIVVKKEKDTIQKGGASRTSPPTRQHSSVSKNVSTFKRFCNKEYGENIWQESFFDHIIRSNEDYEEHLKYIHENPIKWYYKNK
ncbi:MAG: transposase [Clostridia bacterium]|nr:transposase [Clostridia bacterium]